MICSIPPNLFHFVYQTTIFAWSSLIAFSALLTGAFLLQKMHSAFCCILLFLLAFRSCSPRLQYDAGGGDGFGRGERNNISHPGAAKREKISFFKTRHFVS